MAKAPKNEATAAEAPVAEANMELASAPAPVAEEAVELDERTKAEMAAGAAHLLKIKADAAAE